MRTVLLSKQSSTKELNSSCFIPVRSSELIREEFGQAEYFFILLFFCQETVHFTNELNKSLVAQQTTLIEGKK